MNISVSGYGNHQLWAYQVDFFLLSILTLASLAGHAGPHHRFFWGVYHERYRHKRGLSVGGPRHVYRPFTIYTSDKNIAANKAKATAR